MPISKHFQSTISKKFEVNFSQIMPNGFLKITELLNFLQLTAAEHAELGGIAFADMQLHNQAWVLSKIRLEIIKLPQWKDEVTVETWIVSLENSRSLRALKVSVGAMVVATCETWWVVFNTKTRRPESLALPHEHFEKFPNRLVNTVKIDNSKPVETANVVAMQSVLLSDLDMVNHVNHIKYLEWCLDYMPVDVILKNQISAVEMYFMSELLYGDAVQILNDCSSDKLVKYAIMKNEKTCFAANVFL